MGDCLDIFSNDIIIDAFRILFENVLYNEPIFFNIEHGIQKPVDIGILNEFCPAASEMKASKIILKESNELRKMIVNDSSTEELISKNKHIADVICNLKVDEGYPAKCIEKINVTIYQPYTSYICNSNIKIEINYKIFMLVKFINGNYIQITLPDDENLKFFYCENVIFPISYSSSKISKELTIDKKADLYVINIKIPLTDYYKKVYLQNYPPLKARAILKNTNDFYDIMNNPCTYKNLTATHTVLCITSDIYSKIGVFQNILIQ